MLQLLACTVDLFFLFFSFHHICSILWKNFFHLQPIFLGWNHCSQAREIWSSEFGQFWGKSFEKSFLKICLNKKEDSIISKNNLENDCPDTYQYPFLWIFLRLIKYSSNIYWIFFLCESNISTLEKFSHAYKNDHSLKKKKKEKKFKAILRTTFYWWKWSKWLNISMRSSLRAIKICKEMTKQHNRNRIQ